MYLDLLVEVTTGHAVVEDMYDWGGGAWMLKKSSVAVLVVVHL